MARLMIRVPKCMFVWQALAAQRRQTMETIAVCLDEMEERLARRQEKQIQLLRAEVCAHIDAKFTS